MPADPFLAALSLSSITLGFTGNPLDRADQLRRDEAALERLRRDAAARMLAFSELRVAVDPAPASGGACDLLWLSPSEVPADAPSIFLGMDGDRPCFAVSLPPGAVPRGELMEVRAAATQMPDEQAAILAQARSLFAWHARHGYCAVCGTVTRVVKGGYQRLCQNAACGAEHFPRTDPVVIMLVIDLDGDRCLLGRAARLPAGMYSALAGFVEPAETIEEAVAREVREESGVRVGRVRYIASQPWPFPSSLMIGCFAEALTRELEIDHQELEQAGWFTRADVRAALAGDGPFVCPPPLAIAHALLKTWISPLSSEPEERGAEE